MRHPRRNFPQSAAAASAPAPHNSPQSWQSTGTTLRLPCGPQELHVAGPTPLMGKLRCPLKRQPAVRWAQPTCLCYAKSSPDATSFSARNSLEAVESWGRPQPSVGPAAPPLLSHNTRQLCPPLSKSRPFSSPADNALPGDTCFVSSLSSP